MLQDLHEIQASILKELLFNNGTNFSSLNITKLDNNHFTFHIKKLIDVGLVQKYNGKYFLTELGKQEAGQLDTVTLRFERGGKIGVSVGCKRIVDGKVEFLMQQRLKEPFFGWWGNIAGKVRFGETTRQCALRELKEETGLTGYPIFMGVKHTLRGKDNENVTLDNYFFRYMFINPTGELISTEEGKNMWMVEDDIYKLENKYHGFDSYLSELSSENFISYHEDFYTIDSI